MQTHVTQVRSILTRTGGFLAGCASHSLQPYRGCPFGNALCGVGCYVQHLPYVTQGREWGSFLEVRENSASAYQCQFDAEQRWARRRLGSFAIFLSSATEPFPPQERRHRVTASVLEAMIDRPPDLLILQTHSASVVESLDLLTRLRERTQLRVHVSIETDRDSIPGLPPHACSIDDRLSAAATLREAGVRTVVTVAPLLPIRDPETFFERIARCADAVVLDHYIGGDGSRDGSRTHRTPLPEVMDRLEPGSTSLDYRDAMARLARLRMPGRVGLGHAGFAGVYE